MRIYKNVKLQGARSEIVMKGLIDTGAEISLLPRNIATSIGAWCTDRQRNVKGVFAETRTLPIILAHLYFPELNYVGGTFEFAMNNTEQELIIGIDILKPLGITIDTTTHQLSVKNEIWEAFKILSAIGVIVIGGIKLLEVMSKE